MAPASVEVRDVSKRFRLYHAKYQSLKERMLHAGRNPREDFWALQGVSFEVGEGETIGILGRNGSGKSTLLKCICGILQPTSGDVRVRGDLAALLELGAGFQPDLTGRENVYMNASLLGMSSKEVDRRFDEIVAFAELEQFIDNQVKFYSSGMYIRLGFAVAVNVEPDILVVDEVLAVGDERFQAKCLARIRQFQKEGRTILVVTHAAEQVRQICDRGVVLAEGRLLGIGTSAEAIHLFHDHLMRLEDGEGAESGGAGRAVQLSAIELGADAGMFSGPLTSGSPLLVRLAYRAEQARDDLVFWFSLLTPEGHVLYSADTKDMTGGPLQVGAGTGVVELAFPQVPLLEGTYPVTCGVRSADGRVVFDEATEKLEIVGQRRSAGPLWMEPSVRVVAGSGGSGGSSLADPGS